MNKINFKSLKDAIHVVKDNGTSVDYFISDEYEIHINKIQPHTIQEWHCHSQISEILFIVKGQLLCKYIIDNQEFSKYIYENDLVDVGNTIHTFENDTDESVDFIVFRFVGDGVNKRELIKNDKTVVEKE